MRGLQAPDRSVDFSSMVFSCGPPLPDGLEAPLPLASGCGEVPRLRQSCWLPILKATDEVDRLEGVNGPAPGTQRCSPHDVVSMVSFRQACMNRVRNLGNSVAIATGWSGRWQSRGCFKRRASQAAAESRSGNGCRIGAQLANRHIEAMVDRWGARKLTTATIHNKPELAAQLRRKDRQARHGPGAGALSLVRDVKARPPLDAEACQRTAWLLGTRWPRIARCYLGSKVGTPSQRDQPAEPTAP